MAWACVSSSAGFGPPGVCVGSWCWWRGQGTVRERTRNVARVWLELRRTLGRPGVCVGNRACTRSRRCYSVRPVAVQAFVCPSVTLPLRRVPVSPRCPPTTGRRVLVAALPEPEIQRSCPQGVLPRSPVPFRIAGGFSFVHPAQARGCLHSQYDPVYPFGADRPASSRAHCVAVLSTPPSYGTWGSRTVLVVEGHLRLVSRAGIGGGALIISIAVPLHVLSARHRPRSA